MAYYLHNYDSFKICKRLRFVVQLESNFFLILYSASYQFSYTVEQLLCGILIKCFLDFFCLVICPIFLCGLTVCMNHFIAFKVDVHVADAVYFFTIVFCDKS